MHVHKPHAQANVSITTTLRARVYARRLVPHAVSALSGPAVGQPQAAHARERISVCARRGDLAEEGLAGASLGVRGNC